MYLGECEVHLHPTLTKVWTPKGVRPVVPAAGSDRKACVFGAMNLRTGQCHYMLHGRKNTAQFGEFLRQLLGDSEAGGRRLVLVLDNASYHRTRAVLDLLAAHAGHVLVVWLTRYSPELNLIEGPWGYLKQSSLNNYFFGDVGTLEKAIVGTFKELKRHPETTLSLAYHPPKKLCMAA